MFGVSNLSCTYHWYSVHFELAFSYSGPAQFNIAMINHRTHETQTHYACMVLVHL